MIGMDGTPEQGVGVYRCVRIQSAMCFLLRIVVVGGFFFQGLIQPGWADDPFADVSAAPASPVAADNSWLTDNALFRKELSTLNVWGTDAGADAGEIYSRISVGFEVLKRFSTATETVAAFNYQGRLVYRNQVRESAADPMVRDAEAWRYETHNAYAELYNVFGEPGRFNLRAGRYYLPFGLNYATDTHATLLQLSNDRLFGTERDWQLSAYGNVSEYFDYAAGYVFGSGADQKMDGQSGMAVGRLGLGNAFLFEQGLEAGASLAYGQRLDPHLAVRHVLDTWRAGVDIRKRFDSGSGPWTITFEGAGGEDDAAAVGSALLQVDWLHPARRWGVSAQHVYLDRETHAVSHGAAPDERAMLVVTRYLRNDVGNAGLHWVAVGVERQVQLPAGGEDTLVAVQYYRYW
ncbi:MAG: hypothetical protein NC924_08865 [Candidatus Omnitrophica bacterium]|nr:hypothetical protein [Candidatus Omnitrophota bacterium]